MNKVYKGLTITAVILTLSACAENPGSAVPRKTPYDSFLKVVGSLGGGSHKKVRSERSPLIHQDIYTRSDRDKLIYFYQGRDSRNINFSRTLSEYADKAWLRVKAYTLDHRSLMEFPDSSYASAEVIAKYFGDKKPGFKTPVLFLQQYDAHTIPVSVGDVSFMQLVNKMNRIAENRHKQF